MDSLIIALIGALFGAIATAFVQGYVEKYYFVDKSFFSMPIEVMNKDAHAFLNGRWNEYHVTYDTSLSSEPFWLRGEYFLKVMKDNLVEGVFKITHHPNSILEYNLKSEIKSGRLILTESCKQDASEFAIGIFPNLLSDKILTGIWIGFDWQHTFITGPIILSKKEMNTEELNKNLVNLKCRNTIEKNKIEKMFG